MITKNPENTPFVTQASLNLIREGGRTVGSERVAIIVKSLDYLLKNNECLSMKLEGHFCIMTIFSFK